MALHDAILDWTDQICNTVMMLESLDLEHKIVILSLWLAQFEVICSSYSWNGLILIRFKNTGITTLFAARQERTNTFEIVYVLFTPRGVRTLDPEHAGPSNMSKLSMEGAGTPGTPRRKEGAQRKSFFRTLRRKLNTIKGNDPNAYKALYSWWLRKKEGYLNSRSYSQSVQVIRYINYIEHPTTSNMLESLIEHIDPFMCFRK